MQSRRELVLAALFKAEGRYRLLQAQMVGRLWPEIIESRNIAPIRRKIVQLCEPGCLAHWVK